MGLIQERADLLEVSGRRVDLDEAALGHLVDLRRFGPFPGRADGFEVGRASAWPAFSFCSFMPT
jgi:hypothetical protein